MDQALQPVTRTRARPFPGRPVWYFLGLLILLLAGAVPPLARAQQPGGYLGCFKDQGDPSGLSGRDLNGAIRNDTRMTAQMCTAECQAKGFAYAGTQYGSYCFCGNSYGRTGVAANCDMNCAGNPGEKCGGSWANSVYAAAPQVAAYLGCFKDQGDPNGLAGRDLAGAIRSDPRMTTQMCTAECRAKGFAYAGTQYGSYCFCGNSYGRTGGVRNCDMACAGNAGEKCGGSWANSVYSVSAGAAGPGGGAPPPQGVNFPEPVINGMAVDWCTTWGTACGQPGADQFCRSQGYPRALRWNSGYADHTWVIGSGQRCDAAGRCNALRDVVCAANP